MSGSRAGTPAARRRPNRLTPDRRQRRRPANAHVASVRGLRGLWRAKDVQYSQTTKLRVRWYVDELLGGRRRGIYVALELDPRDYRLPDGTPVDPSLYDGALPTELVAPLARLRTDLDRFSPEEAGLLSYDGYWSTHTRLAALHSQLAVQAPSWREYADLAPEEVSRLRRLLVHGGRRIRLLKRG